MRIRSDEHNFSPQVVNQSKKIISDDAHLLYPLNMSTNLILDSFTYRSDSPLFRKPTDRKTH